MKMQTGMFTCIFADPRIIEDSTFHIYAISDLKSWNDIGKMLLYFTLDKFVQQSDSYRISIRVNSLSA